MVRAWDLPDPIVQPDSEPFPSQSLLEEAWGRALHLPIGSKLASLPDGLPVPKEDVAVPDLSLMCDGIQRVDVQLTERAPWRV